LTLSSFSDDLFLIYPRAFEHMQNRNIASSGLFT